MSEIDHALSQISSIRAQLAGSTRFSGFAPISNTITGLIAIFLTLWHGQQQALFEPESFVLVWGSYLVLMCIFGTISTTFRAYRVHGERARYMLFGTLQRILPFMAGGMTLSWIIFTSSPQSIWLLPGLWLMLIGMAGFSLLTVLPHAIALASAWFFVWGAVVMMISVQQEAFYHWMVGVPLGGGQIAVALILYFSEGVKRGKEHG